jgi:hypothetical protein
MVQVSGKVAKVVSKDTAGTAVPSVKIFLKIKEINDKIEELRVKGRDLQHDTHVLACSVLAHTAKHGNINVLLNFLDAVPDMVRANALQTWFESFGQLTYGAIKEGDDPMWRIDRSKKVKLGDAMVKPFWKFKAHEGSPYIPLDMAKWCETQIKALERDAAKTGHSHDHLIMFLKTYNPIAEVGEPTQTGNGITAHKAQQPQHNAAENTSQH